MIDIRNASLEFATGARVLDDITLSLEPGKSVVILGPNGSGKSSLLRLLAGLHAPTSGEVIVDGFSTGVPADLPAVRRAVGLVFQNPDDQIISSVVESEIAFGLENLGVAWDDMRGRVDEALERFGLNQYRRSDPHALSGGERQRLAIASILVLRPRYLLLDEPTSLLDPVARRNLNVLLQDIHAAADVTTVVVTQFPDEAVEADRVIVLDRGRVALDDAPEAVLSRPSLLAGLGLAAPLPARVAVRCGIPEPVPIRACDLAGRFDLAAAASVSGPSAPHDESDAILSATDLRFVYNAGMPHAMTAIRNLELTVTRGHLVALVGRGGSGKSTFALHLNGLNPVQQGTLTVCGFNLHERGVDADALRRQVGLVFQFPESQLFAETVAADVAFGPGNLGLDDIPDRVDRALETVGLAPATFRERNPLTLSGGEKRRVALAGVLAMTPRLLVLDEPFAGLDPSGADELDGLLNALRARGTTILLVTHDMDRAARLADRVIAFDAGRVAFDLPPDQAFARRGPIAFVGLAPPEAVHLAEVLRASGLDIPDDIVTEEQLGSVLSARPTGPPGPGSGRVSAPS